MMTLAPARPAQTKAPGPTPRVPSQLGSGMGTRTSGFYRHDLDGLRGIAIALVAVFHVWFGRVSGGVDVFLVLSGFFFGGRLLRNALTPGASLRPVTEMTRLIRRLLPALVVVLAVSAVLTILIQPETRWEAFADQSLASLGYYQNWELASTAADYLRAGESVSPLQHIWSMSVQGQFYIAFLALIMLCASVFRRVFGRYARSAFVTLFSALTIASFVYAIIAHNTDQATAYYNSFARAWELLVGVLVGAVVPYVRWPMWLRTVLAVVGLAAILSCGALIDGVHEFPGPWALVPVAATLLFIVSAANRYADPHTDGRIPAPNRLLASKPFVALGAMAYALYLWHWPLLIFYLAHTGGSRVNFIEGAGILLVSGLLAWVTTRYVEEPLRARGASATSPAVSKTPLRTRLRRPTIVLGSTVALLGVALNGTSSVLYGSVAELVPEQARRRAFALFYTATIGAGAAIMATLIAALREGRAADNTIRVVSQFGISVPDFWMGILLIALFSTVLGWLPTSGYRPLFDDPAGWLRHIILPGVTIGLVAAAILTRYVRSAVLEVAASGYVRTARSKGLSPRVVTFRHTVRNALVPILTITGIQLATLLGGVIVVEVVFAWPGLGRLVFNAVAARDYPLIQGAVLLVAVMFIVVNLIVDVLYAVADPRIRVS